MRSFINKKAKNVNSDRFRRTPVKIDNKVTLEVITPEVINENIEVMVIPEVDDTETNTEAMNIETIEVVSEEATIEEQPKPKKKKNVKIENKETKIED